MARAAMEKAARPCAYGPASCELEIFCCCISNSEFYYPSELTDEELGTSSTANFSFITCSFSLNENLYRCILSKLNHLLNFESFAIGIVQK